MATPDKQCVCEGKHDGHICELDKKGAAELIGRRTDDPVVVCLMCGAEANASEYVCSPVPIYRPVSAGSAGTDQE
jgi:hypothetical protein